MPQHLDDFIREAHRVVDAFAEDWRKNNAANPAMYPMEMASGNEGLWWEQFNEFPIPPEAKVIDQKAIAAEKKLVLLNGRGGMLSHRPKDGEDPRVQNVAAIYIAAKSVADAIRMCTEYMGFKPAGINGEIRDFFSNVWGNPMDGIEPERGIWLQFDRLDKPVRVF